MIWQRSARKALNCWDVIVLDVALLAVLSVALGASQVRARHCAVMIWLNWNGVVRFVSGGNLVLIEQPWGLSIPWGETTLVKCTRHPRPAGFQPVHHRRALPLHHCATGLLPLLLCAGAAHLRDGAHHLPAGGGVWGAPSDGGSVEAERTSFLQVGVGSGDYLIAGGLPQVDGYHRVENCRLGRF